MADQRRAESQQARVADDMAETFSKAGDSPSS